LPRTELESKIRPLEQLGYSSQYYFIAYNSLTGNLWIIIGMMTILQSSFNPYNDMLILPILIINQVFIWLIEKLCLYIRRKLKIWEPKVNKVISMGDKAGKGENNQSILAEDNPEAIKLNPFGQLLKKVDTKKSILSAKATMLLEKGLTTGITVKKTETMIGVYEKYKE
jgi:hypothetical protein